MMVFVVICILPLAAFLIVKLNKRRVAKHERELNEGK